MEPWWNVIDKEMGENPVFAHFLRY